MKALILAAGFGTRLLPVTQNIPKPLFPFEGAPLLHMHILRLQNAGCSEIIINTHHLHELIDDFISERNYSIPVITRYEPKILGTGGAIKNTADFWNSNPFIVINSDIVTDIDLKKVYEFHTEHEYPVTLVIHDYPEFNNVGVNHEDYVTGFYKGKIPKETNDTNVLAFTGIQVLDTEVLNFIPGNTFFSSIEAYTNLISSGRKVKGLVVKNQYWKDIGSSDRYSEAVFDRISPVAFSQAFSDYSVNNKEIINRTSLAGDGSDRKWYRLTTGNRSLVMVDHGIRGQDGIIEVDSFIQIGNYLFKKGANVPKIYYSDSFSGQVFLEDLGNKNLQSLILSLDNHQDITTCYKDVINLHIDMAIPELDGFDPAWAYQTPFYSKELILEKECRYFINAFVCKYLGMSILFEDYIDEFSTIAERSLAFAVKGFMHRDFQSRNIMVKGDKYYFIDFQGGRIGPLQYDLASLLLDPYVNMAEHIRDELLEYYVERLGLYMLVDKGEFCNSFIYCSITRNLQMLGAFSFLSREKGKKYFEQYISPAVKSLSGCFNTVDSNEFPKLCKLVDRIQPVHEQIH